MIPLAPACSPRRLRLESATSATALTEDGGAAARVHRARVRGERQQVPAGPAERSDDGPLADRPGRRLKHG